MLGAQMELCCQDGSIVHWPYRRKKSAAVAIDGSDVVVLLTGSAWERAKLLAKTRKAVVVALYDKPTRVLALRKAAQRILEWKVPEETVEKLRADILIVCASGGTRDAFIARLCGGAGEAANWKKRKKQKPRAQETEPRLESAHLRALGGRKREES